jgi:cytochrome c-type biogenesis protein CcmH
MRRDPLRGRFLIILCLSFACGPPTLAADLTPQQAIEEGLMCYCGCANLTVRICTCGTAAQIRQEIASRLTQGETEEEVLAAFVSRHGEQILSAPTKERFNLLAWITPFAVILITATALIVVIRRWAATGAAIRAAVPADAPHREPGLSDEQRRALERVERELREEH